MKKKLITFPNYPIFEISEQAPVVLFNRKVYSIEEEERLDYVGDNFNGAPLIEIGSFEELDGLFLERNQKELNKFKEKYQKEIRNKLVLEFNELDLSQLIYSQLFPFLRGEKYQDKIDDFLSLEKEEKPISKKIDRIDLEKVISKAEDRIRMEKDKIGSIKKENLTETIFGKENQIILNNASHALSKKGKNYSQKLSLNGELFYIKEEEPQRESLKDGTIIYVNSLARKEGFSNIYSGRKGRIIKNLGDDNYRVVFDAGPSGGRYYSTKESLNLREKHFKKIKTSNKMISLNPKDRANKELEERLKLEVLEEEFTREKLIEELSMQDADLIKMKGKKSYEEEKFGFIRPPFLYSEGMMVYEKIAPFIVDYFGDRYLYKNPKVGVLVSKEKNKRGLDSFSEFYLIEDTITKKLCTGNNLIPYGAESQIELIAKRLKKAKDMVTGGFSKDWLNSANRSSLTQLKEYSRLPVIDARTGKRIK